MPVLFADQGKTLLVASDHGVVYAYDRTHGNVVHKMTMPQCLAIQAMDVSSIAIFIEFSRSPMCIGMSGRP